MRKLLLASGELGMTTLELANALGVSGYKRYNLATLLKAMPDAYIYDWNEVPHIEAIWRVVAVPADCPRPTPRRLKPKQKQLIISLVENGSMTDKQIASEVGCSTLVVREVYKAHLEAKHA